MRRGDDKTLPSFSFEFTRRGARGGGPGPRRRPGLHEHGPRRRAEPDCPPYASSTTTDLKIDAHSRRIASLSASQLLFGMLVKLLSLQSK